ncbi:HD-GYP domain-containing protein [Nitrospira lenta]|uniref:Putative Metal dependent phosphohydrolase n=1 Tax=Nitrospira lenta TaxID=1436998 RepID=A0A330L6Q4_9BACT|nr:HD-GYP domain-containing protein [Nitrospira lenta]SPP65384.1 putative Metal dependent phosphohydrolase [Nitrospira lenta]
MAHRTIQLSDLKVGMYLIGVDRSWLHTPFLRHKFQISTQSEIDTLRASGIARVTIDTERGLDLAVLEITPDNLAPVLERQPEAAGPSGATDAPLERTTVMLADNLALAKQRRAEWIGRLNHIFEGTRATGLVSYAEASQLVDEMIGFIFERQAACYAVMGLREQDPTLHEHGLTVCTLSVIIGQALAYPREALQHVGVAALLHDVGLVRLPKNILKRTKSMPPAQQALYDSHPAQGLLVLEKSGVRDVEVLTIIRHHHIDPARPVDTEGQSEQDRAYSALVGIVDQYDELLTGQTGGPPMSSNQAMTQLYQRYRNQPYLLDQVSYLIRAIGVFPLYSLVALKTGEVGIVGSITPGKAHLPILYLCRDAKGASCVPPQELDLAQEPEGGRSIHDIRDPQREGIDVESILRQVAA